MRLPAPFIRLPIRFEAERLRAELDALPESAWAPHPNHIAGNSSLRLISVDGAENDGVDGPMLPTPQLASMPYVRQILAAFGVVWSRSRLLRLAPGAGVPAHADINHHWFYRVRVHIPISTLPEVSFHCGAERVHMAAGEAWIFDNWRQHRVENPTAATRVHLVADTAGNAEFWRFVAQASQGATADRLLRFDPASVAQPLTERSGPRPVMTPGELDYLLLDLRAELTAEGADAPQRLGRYHALLDGFARDWRHLYTQFGEDADTRGQFAQLRDRIRDASRALGEGLAMRTNKVAAHAVLEGRVLRAVLPAPPAIRASQAPVSAQPIPAVPHPPATIARPVFIIAAPRSGSTLLFETLAASDSVSTLGVEGHWMVEGIDALRPGAPDVDSNRLEARHVTPGVVAAMTQYIIENRGAQRALSPAELDGRVFVEKTPKNSLRVPFLRAAFPGARFIFLWRGARDSLASIIEAWGSGRWVTYRGLDERATPWSLLLPPGWRALRDAPPADIAAFQWEAANRTALDDLEQLPREAWMSLSYAQFVAQPAAQVARICAFLGIELDDALRARAAGTMPLSRQTQTPPDPRKWLRHRAEIERVMPRLVALEERLARLQDPPPQAAN